MTLFSQNLLTKKLAQLNQSQESVETVSLWMLHHRRHAATIVNFWNEQFNTVSESRKLALIYLANDIIKAGSGKSHKFRKEFEKVLPHAFRLVRETCVQTQLFEQLQRIIKIWQNNRCFKPETFEKFLECLNGAGGKLTADFEQTAAESDDDCNPKSLKKLFLSLSAPSPDDLIKTLESIEHMPSSDEFARSMISDLPTKFSNLKSLKLIKDNKQAQEFSKNLSVAVEMVENYNERLDLEIEQRIKLDHMLASYKEAELLRLSETQQQLLECEKNMEKMLTLREDIEKHRNSLPDLKNYRSVEELPPLPSAEDLFKK